ncbi:hypothetical protein [Lacipirellula parvula]|uniref:Uncharacterized protein n=1 Tax=Lacipirellula parvula TaxID=2650471 RepID=A0A5K7XFQ8_9BACT|nr:hypothetical protein [Lacipirellula parvula]BBO35694.1 hypothetical protein PLANPX_5306 [Lacipirellula parvula]
MPKEPITQADLEEFVANESDFGFEMKIRRLLTSKSLDPLHGGTYIDPVTGLSRQFDLRVQIRPQERHYRRCPFLFRLAIECKNVRDHYPLLIQCVPRARNESFHDVVATTNRTARVLRFYPRETKYREDRPTGKNLMQVARNGSAFNASDGDVYSKWAQAIASSSDLAVSSEANLEESPIFTFVMPVLVVPDGRLWAINYDEHGSALGAPTLSEAISFFVSAPLRWKHKDEILAMTLSHIEFVTETGLSRLIDSLKSPIAVNEYFEDSLVNRYLSSNDW